MSKEILVPDIGDFENVEVIEILVKEGDEIKINDPLITLESDKSSVEVPSNQEGIIEKLNVKVGDKVSKGDLIVSINSTNNETKTKIPPTTEKIISEAEKVLNTEKIKDKAAKTEKNNYIQNSNIQKTNNRIVVTDANDIDPLETKEWIESLNSVVENLGNERAQFLQRQLHEE